MISDGQAWDGRLGGILCGCEFHASDWFASG